MIPVSAKKNKHLDHLLATVRDFLPEQAFIYGEDEITDKSERFLASEIIREKIFRLTGQEVPYSIAVEIEKFEVEGNLRRIFAAIIVDKESQKPMLIGKDGDKLKQSNIASQSDKSHESKQCSEPSHHCTHHSTRTCNCSGHDCIDNDNRNSDYFGSHSEERNKQRINFSKYYDDIGYR